MAGNEAFLMTCLVLILAVSMRRRRRLFQRMHLISLQMKRIWRNMAILSIQKKNNTHRRLRKTTWVYPRTQFCFEQLILDRYQDHLWREHSRVSKETFEHISALVGPQLVCQNTILREGITVEKRMPVALWRFSYWQFLPNRGINIWNRSLDSHEYEGRNLLWLIRRANNFIKFPETEAESRQTIQEFENISRFPQVVGALDGSHIPIKAPKDDANEYVNQKKFP